MRNLKKILALVLALMMTLSLMVTANASSYTDADQVSDKYEEAVEVLSGMGVFQGTDKGVLLPKNTLTRREAAVLVYRLLSGDVEGKYLNNYKGYAAEKFSDVSADAWYEPYVAYSVNGNYIQGDGKGHFNPDDDITGTEVLAILLRAVGYDKNGEFSENWPLNVATLAKDLGVTDTVNGVLLTKAVPREVVAELIFRTITGANMVNYTPAFGYQPITLVSGGLFGSTTTLGQKVFGLGKSDRGTIDAWGRPGYVWTYNTGDEETVIAEDYVVAYNKAVTECDVASAAGIKTSKTYDTYTNGRGNTSTKTIVATATISKIGAQGRLTEVYKDRIVYIDTYLSNVVAVANATFDAAGHLKNSSSLTLDVYTSIGTGAGAAERVTLYGGSDNYSYTKGQMLLVNAVDASNGSIALKASTYGTTPSTLKIVKVADSLIGAQTTIWYNVEQHTVNGTTYNDSHTFYLDQAGTETSSHTWYFDQYGNLIGVTDIATQYTYGVISSMWWVNDSTNGSGKAYATLTYMDGSTATVVLSLIDDDGLKTGNLGYVPVYCANENVNSYATDGAMGKRVETTAAAPGQIGVTTNAYINVNSANNGGHGIIGGHMFQFETLADGTVAAYKVMNEVTANVNKGVSAITGGTTTFYTNSETVYLVKNPATGVYTSVTDYNNIGNYTNVVVDYVVPTGSIYAKYVYIIGASIDNTSAFVMGTGSNYSATLKTVGGVSYYEFTYGLNMDGTTSVMKVDANHYADVITKMVNGVGKLFKIDYTNGVATNATEVTATSQVSGAYTAVFLGNDVTATANALYNADGVLGNAINNTHYNVTSSTVVIGGTLADLAAAGKNVYIVYATNNPNYVTHIYITNFAKNTVADAVAVLNVSHDYGTLTVTATAGDNLNANVLNLVNAKLAANGITGVTASLNPGYNVTAPAVGTTETKWFQIELSDALGGTASVGSNYIAVTNSNTTTGLNETIKSHLEAMTSVTANMTKAQVENRVNARVAQVVDTSKLTITVVLPSNMQAGQIVNVVVTGTVNGVAVNTSAQVVVQQ